MIGGSLVALAIMLTIWFRPGADAGAAIIGGTLLNMAVFAAMCSYVLQAVSFILLRTQHSAYRAALSSARSASRARW